MKKALPLGVFISLATGSLLAGTLSVTTNLTSTYHFVSRRYVDWNAGFFEPLTLAFSFDHVINGADGTSGSGRTSSDAPYTGTLTVPNPHEVGTCYKAVLLVTSAYGDASAESTELCYQGPVEDPGGGGGGPQDPICDIGCSPIVLNLGSGGFELVGPSNPVLFDINADGLLDRITWTAPDAPMAFLALDRNTNGIIDDGSELFGDRTRRSDGTFAVNGFEALRDFDSDGNGVIDSADASFERLRLWTDKNHNGVSEYDELSSIASSTVRTIRLTYHWTGRKDVFGNTFRYEALATISGERRPIYDIYFVKVK